MSYRVDPALLSELKEYGAVNVEACFNCGNCTAVCPLTDDNHMFPRNTIRAIQMGLKDRLLQNSDPWLCYYCGECSATCPREAEPGETMMAMRRWLTAQYDWTGLARKFYTSHLWEIGSMVFVGLAVVLLALLLHGPIITENVELNAFAPIKIVHYADWIMAAGLLFFIGTNTLRMHSSIMRSDTRLKIPLHLYLSESWHIVYHALTQAQWVRCADDEADRGKRNANILSWISHLLLVSGYGLMLVLVVVFLPWFQTDNIYPFYHPQRWLGYYATVVLFFGAGKAIWGRIKKDSELHRFSHLSDWIFPILLLVVTATGILQHAFRYLGLGLPTYYTYVVHLAFAAPMLILEVPFGKWSHLYYRPLAMYFEKVKERALREPSPDLAPAGAD